MKYRASRKQINQSTTADLFFNPSLALHQKAHIDNMLHLERLEDEPKSGAILAHLFISATHTPRLIILYIAVFDFGSVISLYRDW
jgi:hypothetical protein